MTTPVHSGQRPLRVVHVFGIMETGGAELRILELMEAFGGSVQPIYVTLSGHLGSLNDRIVASGGRVVPIPLTASFPGRFTGLLAAARPAVLHSHVHGFSGPLVTLGRAARVPVRICQFHSDSDGAAGTARRQAYRAATRTLVTTSSTAVVGIAPSTLESSWGSRWTTDPLFHIIPNPVAVESPASQGSPSLRQRFGIPEEAIVMGHVGRPSLDKNRGFLIDVLAAAVAHVSSHLVLVGPPDDDAEKVLMQSATSLGVQDRVHFAGHVQSVQDTMRQFDIVLLTSIREGLPSVVIEAGIVGTPVLSSDLPGSRFIAQYLDRIETIPLQAGPERWAATVQRMVHEPRLSAEDALRAFNDSPFTVSAAVPAWAQLYGMTGTPQ